MMWVAMLGDTEHAPPHFSWRDRMWGTRDTFVNVFRQFLTHDSCEAADCRMRKESEVTFEKQ